MSGITFSIQNPSSTPANQAYLYLGQANTLNFVFSNPPNLNIKQLNPGDIFRIAIPSNLLVSADEKQLNSPDWTVQVIQPSSGNANYTFLLSPAKPIDFSNPVTICLQQLHGTSTSIGDVSTSYKIGGRPMSGSSNKLSVLNPPNQPLNLNDAISFEVFVNNNQSKVPAEQLYLSSTELQPPIANRIHLNLKFNGQELVPSWKPEKRPMFTVSFAYGNDESSLTNAIKASEPQYNALTSAWNINCALNTDEDSLWMVQPLNTSPDTPNWIIYPETGNTNLFTNQAPNLDVIFTHIISVLSPGNATIYIQWNYISGYNDGVYALDILKILPEPQILNFYSKDNGNIIKPGESVQVNWEVFNAKTLALSWDLGGQTREVPAFDASNPQLWYAGSDNGIIPDSPQTDIFLTANGDESTKKGPISVTTSPFPGPVIKQFSGQSARDAQGNVVAELAWLVEDLGNTGYFELNGVKLDGAGYNGKLYGTSVAIEPSTFSMQFELQAVDTFNGLSSSKMITVQIPRISKFTAAITRDGNGSPTLAVNWEVVNLFANTQYTFNAAACTVDEKGRGGISIPLSEKVTLQQQYTFEMLIPGQAPMTQTLKAQYTLKELIGQSPDGKSFSRNLSMSQDGKVCVAFYTQNSYEYPDTFLLAQFDTVQYQQLKFSSPYANIDQDGYFSPDTQITLSPDNKQVFIHSSQLKCILFENGVFDPQVRIAAYQIPGGAFTSYRCVFNSDMSFVYMANGSYLYYRKPDPTAYTLLGAPPDDKGISTIEGHMLSYLAIQRDGKRVFVIQFFPQNLYWFDSDNPPSSLGNQRVRL